MTTMTKKELKAKERTLARTKERYYSRWVCPKCKLKFTKLLSRKNHRKVRYRFMHRYYGLGVSINPDCKVREPVNCPNRHCSFKGKFVSVGSLETRRVVI